MFKSRANEKDQGGSASKNKDVNVPLVHSQDGKDFDPKRKSTLDKHHTFDDDDQSEEAVQAQERKRRKRRIMKIAVYFMFAIVIIGVFAIWLFHKDPVEYIRFGTEFIFTVKLRSLEMLNFNGDPVLYADVGRQLKLAPYDHCWDDSFKNYEEHCLYWRKTARLRVSEYTNKTSVSCYTLKWEGFKDICRPADEGQNPGFHAEDCFYLQHFHWYGYLTENILSWPISTHLQYTNFYPTYPEPQNNSLVPVWFGAQNVAIFVNPGYAFSVAWNVTDKRQFCIKSVNTPVEDGVATPLLEYTLCQGLTPQDVFLATHKYRVEMDLNLNNDSNSNSLAPQKPVYGLSDQKDISTFTKHMSHNSTDYSFVELFEGWEKNPGDLSVDPALEGQVDSLIKVGENHNFHIIFPIIPFFSHKSSNFYQGIDKGYFVMDSLKSATRLMVWRGMQGAALDLTNPSANKWFLTRVKKLMLEKGIKAIKLLHPDIPLDSSFQNSNITYLDYSRMFYHQLATLDVTLVLEMAAGFVSLPVFTPIRMNFLGEPGSSCMEVSIPNSFTMGMSGYPLLVAEAGNITSVEMYKRWLQLAIFYPALKIPSSPVLNTIDLQGFFADALTLRNTEFLPYLNKVWKQQYNLPIIRPLWWSTPKNSYVLGINDEFMVGDNLLVAPVLCEGVVSRPVYLPEGKWVQSGMKSKVVYGLQTIIVDTDEANPIPYFWKHDYQQP